jgi:hypothetical protein
MPSVWPKAGNPELIISPQRLNGESLSRPLFVEETMFKRSLFAVTIIAFLLVGCAPAATPAPSLGRTSGSNNVPSIAVAPGAPAVPGEQSASGSSSGNPFAAGQKDISSQPYQAATAAPNGGSSQPAPERIVIRNADMTLVVADPVKALDTITKLAGDNGGFVVSSNTHQISLENGGQAPEASITIRVKAENLDAVLATIRKLVKNADLDILNENVTGQDVTKEYTDLQSRLKNLQQAEAQLREIMASATKPEDVLTVFNQLTQVREQIEVLQGQINYYQESAALSSVAVEIKAEASITPLTIGSWQPAGVARDALQTTLNGLKTVANAAIWLVLFVLPIALVIFIPLRLLWALFQWLRRRNKTRKPLVPPAGTPPAEA